MESQRNVILYKCPYCIRGRFTAEDGWDGAIKHIKEKHQNGRRRKRRLSDVSTSFDDLPLGGEELLEAAAFG